MLLITRVVTNVRMGLYSRGWRFASVPDLTRIALAAGAGSIVAFAIAQLGSFVSGDQRGPQLPAFVLAHRAAAEHRDHRRRPVRDPGRLRMGARARIDGRTRPAAPTLLYGAGRTGVLMARSAVRKPDAGVVPVGFIDDDPSLAGGRVDGLQGLSAASRRMEQAIVETGAQSS